MTVSTSVPTSVPTSLIDPRPLEEVDTGPSEAKRCFPDDLESRRQRALLALKLYASQPLDDRPVIADVTGHRRDRTMVVWRSFIRDVLQVDPDSIWLDLCLASETAKDYCRVFLRAYVENSERRYPVLGPQEYEYRRTVNTASSVTQFWRGLIAQADSTVLLEKRRQDPKNKALWRLKFIDHTKQRAQGPIFEISKWIYDGLADELGLTVNQTFEKVEATAEDIIVVLNTLWERAGDINCEPDTRLAFHAVLLTAGIGGFRPASMMRLPYRQVSLAVVRDPNDRTRTRLVATIVVKKNKKKRASRSSRADAISFSITLVPYPNICLASLIATRAITDDAFEPSFESVDALLRRPALEGVDFLPLKWKKEMLDRPIFPLAYSSFNYLWHRTCLVAGFREDSRIYALRVGAGARLDGVLSDALRNYILSNTTQVFQGSYQTKRVREDLMGLAFGSMAGRNNALFQRLRNMSLQRDANAPIGPSEEDLREFEQRKDVCDLRGSLEAAKRAGDRKAATALDGQLRYIIKILSSLKVQEKRAEYFSRVDGLRALGLPTVGTPAARTAGSAPGEGAAGKGAPGKVAPRKRSRDAAAAVARFLQSRTRDVDEHRPFEQCSERFMNLLVGYLTRRPEADPSLDAETSEREADDVGRATREEDKEDEKDEAGNAEGEQGALPSSTRTKGTRGRKEQPRCLLGCGVYCRRSELTKHYKKIHVKNGTFKQPFWCPECRRLGMEDSWISGGESAWSNHVETVHDKIHAPYFPSYSTPAEDPSRCLICSSSFLPGRGLTRHFRLIHVRKEGMFEQPFPCPECRRQGKEDTWIDGLSAWPGHVASVHGEVQAPDFPSGPSGPCHSPSSPSDDGTRKTFGGKKRKRDEGDAGAGGSSAEVMTDVTTDAATDVTMSGTQTPASSVDSDILLRIDPRLLTGEVEVEERERKIKRHAPAPALPSVSR